MVLREFELGAIQVHILHHATIQPFYGRWMVDELARHGYSVSFGTLYPTLHRMERAGLLVHDEQRDGRTIRKFYRATPAGYLALVQVRRIVRELYTELIAQDDAPSLDGVPPAET